MGAPNYFSWERDVQSLEDSPEESQDRFLPLIKMNKHKEFEKYAMKILLRYQKILHLTQHYPLTIEFIPDHPGAEFKYHYPYSTASVGYGPSILEKFKKRDFKYIEKVMVHELCHAITDPFYTKAVTMWVSKSEVEDERERLTDHIANIVLLLNGKRM